MRVRASVVSSCALAFVLGAAACGTGSATPEAGLRPEAAVAARRASVAVEARSGSALSGKVLFEEAGAPDANGVRALRITIDLAGLTPGDHGFHVHQNGDCSDPKADSAGPHFDVGGHAHGDLHDAMSHVGDLGNLTADASGRALKVIDGVTKVSLVPGAPNSLVGRAIVVHDKPDDLKTQPTGASGPRIGCGVVALDPGP
jgi:Cu-Zn family superoxide dismutase